MKIKYLSSGTKGILKHEGVISLISRGFRYLLHRFFVFEDYYVIVVKFKDTDKEVEADYLPEVDNHCYRIITNNQEVDKLIADGFELGAYELNLRMSVEKGAIAFCHFVGKEFAHFTFYADNPRGKEVIDLLPFKVDFENGQMISGKSLTVPKYRNLRLRNYNGYVMRKYLWSKGFTGSVFSIAVNNYRAMVSAAKPPEKRIVSRCRFIKILWFKYFKEKRMEPISIKEFIDKIPERYKKRR